MSIVRAFNDHFGEFVGDVVRAFPDDIDIATAEITLKSLRKTNPKLILTTFQEYVVNPYREKIDAGDITFFISKDYNSDLKDFGETTTILSKIESLREPIRRMKDTERTKVSEYLQNLAKLCDLYT